ncbi:MAG: DUF1573 domain-containing protein [Clostridium sp.]|nr:DUF1573 domain-containing protein [Clostridium sp.]
MKNLIISAAMLIMASLCALAEDQAHWLQTTYDFGAFREDGDKVEAIFKLVNDSPDSLAIISAAATCGCTVPHYDTEAIAPGDTAQVRVVYNPEGRPGRFEKQVYVRTTASRERQKLTIKGVVIGNDRTVGHYYPVDAGKLKLRNGLAMLGRVPAGHSKTEFLTGYNQSADTIRPAFDYLPAYLSVKCSPEAVGPGDMATIEFYFNATKCGQWGIVSDSIKISANPGEETHWLPVVAIIEEDFSALTDKQRADAPALSLPSDHIDLPEVPLNSTTPITYKLKITNTGKDPLIIRRAYSQDPAVTVQAPSDKIKGGKSAEITVTYDPSCQPTGLINTKMAIISNDPAVPTRTVRILAPRR